MKRFLLSMMFISLFAGCALPIKNPGVELTTFTKDIAVPAKSKGELFNASRNHFAMVYGDMRSVFSVVDSVQGIMIGKGIVGYIASAGMLQCKTGYSILLAAKDEKVRVQFVVLEGGMEPCTGWPYPDEGGFEDVRGKFSAYANNLESALNGSGIGESLKGF